MVMDMTFNKTCKRCLIPKTSNDFYGEKKNKDGFRLYCKTCDKENNRKTYFRNKEYKK